MVRRSCRVDLPEAVDFRVGAGGARFLAHGWSWPEPTGVWNDGPEASLLFDIGARPESDLLLELEGFPFAAEKGERPVHAYLNDELLEVWSPAAGVAASLRIPAKALRHGVVMVVLKFPSTASPSPPACPTTRGSLPFTW